MLAFLAAPGFQPFLIAGLIVLGLLLVEVLSLTIGHSATMFLESLLHFDMTHIGVNHPESGGSSSSLNSGSSHSAASSHSAGVDIGGGGGVFGTIFDWLNAGRVPLLVLIMAALATFAIVGLTVQIVAMHVAAPLPTGVAVVLALAATFPGTRWASRIVAWVVPRDESYVLTQDDFVGLTGVVTLGPVALGEAARAKIQDRHGNWHFPRVRPAEDQLVIEEGSRILVVDRLGGELLVVPAAGRLAEG